MPTGATAGVAATICPSLHVLPAASSSTAAPPAPPPASPSELPVPSGTSPRLRSSGPSPSTSSPGSSPERGNGLANAKGQVPLELLTSPDDAKTSNSPGSLVMRPYLGAAARLTCPKLASESRPETSPSDTSPAEATDEAAPAAPMPGSGAPRPQEEMLRRSGGTSPTDSAAVPPPKAEDRMLAELEASGEEGRRRGGCRSSAASAAAVSGSIGHLCCASPSASCEGCAVPGGPCNK
mmetsp:Transcript_4230/g.15838  ORF Transcript_4230/g.15838 Transcript_4230/m.15838 type:complete len:237 (+) Transcript_4230:914-1624(+)